MKFAHYAMHMIYFGASTGIIILSSTEEMYLPLEMDEVTVDGEMYPVQCNSFFVTEEPLHRFSVGDAKVFVGSNLIWRQPIK